MKNVKTMYRKLTMMVVLGILLAVMSCNNLLTPPKGNSTDRDSGSGNVSEDGKVLITIKLFTGSARMVMPDIEQLDWHITAEQGTDNIEATGTYPTYTLELPTTGNWTFTVKGTKENKELFTGTATENVSNSTTSISIPLSPGNGMGEGSGATGKLNLTIKPENVNSMGLKYRIDDSEKWESSISIAGSDYTISNESLSVGQHTLDLYFFSNSNKGKFYFCTVAVNIWPGMTSDQWIKTNGEEYINNKGEFVITEEMVNKFVKTMGSVVFVDASVNTDEPATGSIFAPVKTVSTAVDILQKANPGGNYSGTIMVSGATTIDQAIDVKSGETLTIKGRETGASIENTSGRVFNITGGSVTLGDGITLTGTVTGENARGGAVYVTGGNFTMESGSTIADSSVQGTSASGGGVYVMNGTFIMEDGSKITGSSATASGGGVAVSTGGTFTMRGGTIGGTDAGSANTADNGGGVYMSGGEFEMTGTAILQGNTATTHGGGVHILSGGTFTMNGGTIGGDDANTAEFGGGVFVSGGTFNMNDGTISGNTVTKSGGGVCVYKGTFTMNDGTIGGISEVGTDVFNHADVAGGGVYVGGGTFTMNGGGITGNESDGNGGGVYLDDTNAKVTLNNTSSISGNVVAGEGGGVYVGNGTFTLSGSPNISRNGLDGLNNVYLTSGKTISIGAGDLTGGTIGVTAGEIPPGGVVRITNKNVPGADGIFTSDEEGYTIVESSDAVYLSDAETVYVAGTDGTETFGAFETAFSAVDRSADGGTITLLKDIDGSNAVFKDAFSQPQPITFTGGTETKPIILDLNGKTINRGLSAATNNGSVIKIEGGTLTIKDSSAAPDGTGTITGGNSSGGGGGIHITDKSGGGIHGSLILESGNISGNTADMSLGGGIYIDSDCAFTMKGGSIDGNTVKNSDGGGVFVYGTFTMENGSITNNRSEQGNGGGVNIGSNGAFTMSGGTISGNTATSNGGGVCVSGDGLGFSTFTMSGGTIGGNTATNNGGGVYVGTGNFTLGSSSTESSPVVSGNTKIGGSPNNVYLNDNTLLLIAGELNETEGSGNIGITMANPIVFTEGWTNSGLLDTTFFFSDDTQYKVEVNADELQLINK